MDLGTVSIITGVQFVAGSSLTSIGERRSAVYNSVSPAWVLQRLKANPDRTGLMELIEVGDT